MFTRAALRFHFGRHLTHRARYHAPISLGYQQVYHRSLCDERGALPLDDSAGQWAVGVGKGRLSPGYSGAHDLGGVEALLQEAVDAKDKGYSHWERQMHAVLLVLVSKGLMSVDEMRRGIEQLHPEHYRAFGYYEKWAASTAQILLERQEITDEELDAALFGRDVDDGEEEQRFQAGDVVHIREEDLLCRHRKPHLRTPGYLFGCNGVVERYCGSFGDPEFLAFRGKDKKQHLYRVRLRMVDVWPDYEGSASDTVEVEVYQSWLDPGEGAHHVNPKLPQPIHRQQGDHPHAHSHDHHHHHHHHHDHHDGHEHLSREEAEQEAVALEGEERPGERLVHAITALVKEKGIVSAEEVRKAMEKLDELDQAGLGSRIVAKAWVDAEFKKRLLEDGNAACLELGIVATNATTHTLLTALESTEDVHNLVVCTLCSCYPTSILGLSPPWYKSRAYRARAVRAPRQMLESDFGLKLDDSVRIKVHDSTAGEFTKD